MTAIKLVHSNLDPAGKRDYINHKAQLEPIMGVRFTDFIESYLNSRKGRQLKNKRSYESVSKQIENFCRLYNAVIYTNSINEDFLWDFKEYLKEQNLAHGYLKMLIDLVKAIARKAQAQNYAVDVSFNNFELKNEIPFSIYLTEKEIARIYYAENLSKAQQKIKDAFVVGCYTGLRFSDFSRLSKQNFTKDFIIIPTQKTGITVHIPISDYVHEIFEKYEKDPDFNFSIQHFNRYIKRICKRIGFDEEITYTQKSGGIPQLVTEQKWELITSHTARRSFATNTYLSGRMKTYEIMAITGHTTEKSFFRYIKITQENKVRKIAGDMFFRK